MNESLRNYDVVKEAKEIVRKREIVIMALNIIHRSIMFERGDYSLRWEKRDKNDQSQ